jgi:hypothetical protein
VIGVSLKHYVGSDIISIEIKENPENEHPDDPCVKPKKSKQLCPGRVWDEWFLMNSYKQKNLFNHR